MWPDHADFPSASLSLSLQPQHARAYRELHVQITAAGYTTRASWQGLALTCYGISRSQEGVLVLSEGLLPRQRRLPWPVVASTPIFRSRYGAYGRYTLGLGAQRGLNRSVHHPVTNTHCTTPTSNTLPSSPSPRRPFIPLL